MYTVAITILLKNGKPSDRIVATTKGTEEEAMEAASKLDKHVADQMYRDATSPKVIVVDTSKFKLRVQSYEFAGMAIEVLNGDRVITKA